MWVAGFRQNDVETSEEAEGGQEGDDGEDDPAPEGSGLRVYGREDDAGVRRCGVAGADEGDVEELVWLAVTDLLRQDYVAGEGAAIHGENGVVCLESGGCGLGQKGGEGSSASVTEEGYASEVAAVGLGIEVLPETQVEVREREERHYCEKEILEASRSLQHRKMARQRLAAW